jgi:hypothetical protein
MTKHEKVANIVAFLSILFGEDREAFGRVMDLPPDYIIEKFERYVLSQCTEYAWGMHPSLRNGTFQKYVDKWELELNEERAL